MALNIIPQPVPLSLNPEVGANGQQDTYRAWRTVSQFLNQIQQQLYNLQTYLNTFAYVQSVSVDNLFASPELTGNVTFSNGPGISLVQAANNIQVGSTVGTFAPTKITVANSPYNANSPSASAGILYLFADTTGGAISVILPAPASNTGGVVILMNTGTNTITVSSASGSVIHITSIPHTSGNSSVQYLSDGMNWYSIMNSTGN
jgi:hypothetical protein